MSLMRNAIIAGSRSPWLRDRAVNLPFVKKAVDRFIPGEKLDDALEAGRALRARGMNTVLTHLGENVAEVSEAVGVMQHYADVIERIQEEDLDTEVSVKLSHLGLDLMQDLAVTNLEELAERADAAGTRIWVDMEDSSYVKRTLEVFREVQRKHRRVGICLQSYLRRTAKDLDALLPLGCGIRLVKGAYNEHSDVAYPKKGDVDRNYFRLAARVLSAEALGHGTWAVMGTHDTALIRKINEHVKSKRLAKSVFEYDMLYGIRPEEQERLVREGYRVRVLISYGSEWFAWYMRRLAERPANVMFAMKNLFF